MKGIIAYGTEEDREKLAALAQHYHLSGSQWLLYQIREMYKEIFGQEEPKRFIDTETKR